MLPARHPAETSMEAALPTVQAIQEIESRQDEVLRKLDELEKRISQTLAQFGDDCYSKKIETAQDCTVADERILKAA
jgi:hypothetical protein